MPAGTGRRAFAGWLAGAAGLAIADQIAKEWALAYLKDPVALFPSLNLILVHNPGAAFGFLSQAGGWQRWFFIAAGLAIGVFVAVWLRRAARSDHRWLSAGLCLVLGGALGNLWDRIVAGSGSGLHRRVLREIPLAGIQRGRRGDLGGRGDRDPRLVSQRCGGTRTSAYALTAAPASGAHRRKTRGGAGHPSRIMTLGGRCSSVGRATDS